MPPSPRLTPALALTLALTLPAQDHVAGNLLQFHDNGAWSWFEDERAIVDRVHDLLIVGSCADGSGLDGALRNGDIDVSWLDLRTGRFGTFELRDRLQGDDHNSPALLVRRDGRILAFYATHGSDRLARRRVTLAPGDPTQWTPEQSFTDTANLTYSNLHALADYGLVYDFTRSVNFDPNVWVSHDDGDTWSYGGKLLTEGSSSDRPYLKYASDGRRRVHLLATNRHPRNFDNSIFHGYVEGSALHRSDGTIVDANVLDAGGQPPSALTTVFATGTLFGGVPLRRAWTIDLALDEVGSPRALVQARANDLATDHRLLFSRWDGSAWTIHEVCALGNGLYTAENDYTGLGALHPDDPSVVFVSTPIDPRNGASLAHHEIFRGHTADSGQTWTFTAITSDSSVDNLRPIVPAWGEGRTALLWLRGTYTTYTDYDLAVVGTIDAPELRLDAVVYTDATQSNTALAQGGVFAPTGPGSGQGAADGNWHERTGFGNGGSVLTTDETASEDAPMLRTRLTGVAAGDYDVWAFFWSNPSDDWRLRAGPEQGALRTLAKQGAETVAPGDTTVSLVTTGPTVALYRAWLGRSTVAANGVLDVFVDDLASGQTIAQRTWYDGIGIAPVRRDAAVLELGTACGAVPAALDVTGSAAIGGPGLTLSVHGPAGASAFLLFGIGDVTPLGLDALGFAPCTIYASGVQSVALGALGPNGASPALHVPMPSAAQLIGLRAVFQGAVIAPGLALSTAARVTLGS